MFFVEDLPFSKFSRRHTDKIVRDIFSEFEKPTTLFKTSVGVPPISKIEETDSAYLIHISLPGHNSESIDIDINTESKSFIINAKSAKSSNAVIALDYDLEYSLPGSIEAGSSDAKVKDGILTLTLKKAKALTKSYKIAVK